MEERITSFVHMFPGINWLGFTLLAAILALVYVLSLWVLYMPWIKTNLGTNHLLLRFFKYLYWPIATTILVVTFILIQPVYHGLIVLIILIFGWSYLKEILTGSFIKFSQLFKLDSKYKYGNQSGKLTELSMVGGHFKSPKGVQFLTYSQMLDARLFQVMGESSALDMTIICNNDGSDNFSINHIQDIIFDCPFVDHFIKPQIKKLDDDSIQFSISTRNLVKEDQVIQYFSKRDPSINYEIEHNQL